MAGANYLTNEQVERIERVLTAFESGDLGSLHRGSRRQLYPARVIVGLLESSVAAVTALTGKPKLGTINVYGFTSTGTTATGRTETVHNFAPSAATTDRWTIAERDDYTGKWVITTQYCS